MDQTREMTSLNVSPDVTFVTVYFNTPDATRALLKSFENARFGFAHEYYLIDNNPAARMGTEIKRDHPWVQVILSPKNSGFGVGNNIGMRRARGRYVILVNPDLKISPGEMEKWITWMD
ncbi:MAG: glycosyltransferase, partial [Candidatus Uhrbacteria bacterium]|nr:glycosyltransferase [Candidatus Uhrbacteria bacterium]